MKKNKTAALLAAAVLLYGGVLSAQAEQYYNDGQEHSLGKVTMTDLAVDNGTTVNLAEGSSVNGTYGNLSTEGGTVNMTGTTVSGTGLWANRNYNQGGVINVTGGSIQNGDVVAQGKDSQIKIDGSTVRVSNVTAQQKVIIDDEEKTDAGNTEGGKISFVNGADVTADTLTVDGGNSEININGSTVTANAIQANSGVISVGGENGKLTVNGTADFKNSSSFSLTSQAAVDINGTVTLDGTSALTINGATATFKAGSELHVENGTIQGGVQTFANDTNGVSVTNSGQLIFESGSSAYTTAQTAGADTKEVVNTIATADSSSTITVEEGANLYVTDAVVDGETTYDFSKVIVKDGAGQSWNGKIYGDSKTDVLNKETGLFEANSISDTWTSGIMGVAAFDAALQDGNSKAAEFVDWVKQSHAEWGDKVEASYDARVKSAFNSLAGLTGLAGVGFGTYRFTNVFTELTANHEEGDLWAQYIHDKSSVDGLSVGSLSADYDLTFDGAVIGSDFYQKGNVTVGAAFAYADGDISTNSGVSTSNDVDYYGGMIYGAVKGGAGMTYRAEIGYNRSSNDLTQWNTGKRITGSVDADAFHVGVAAEKEIRTGSSVWTPFLGLQYIDLSIDDYSDSLGFRHEGDSAGLWNMPLGVNYKYETTNGGWTYAPSVTVGYRFAFGDDGVDETFRYNGGSGSFGTEIAEDSFFTRVGFLAKKENMGFGVHYGYERGSDTEANQWGINCSFYF